MRYLVYPVSVDSRVVHRGYPFVPGGGALVATEWVWVSPGH
jgi:hypothetical protein